MMRLPENVPKFSRMLLLSTSARSRHITCRQCLTRFCTSQNFLVSTVPQSLSLISPETNHHNSNNIETTLEYTYLVTNSLNNQLMHDKSTFFPTHYNSFEQNFSNSLTVDNYFKKSSPSKNTSSQSYIKKYKLSDDDIVSTKSKVTSSLPQCPLLRNREIIFFNNHLIPSHLLYKFEIFDYSSDKKVDKGDDEKEKDNKNMSRKSADDDSKPSKDKLETIESILIENFLKIFSEKHDFSIYTKDIEFVNNWFPDKSYSTVGTMQYALELAKLKIYVLVRLANSKMTLLKVTNHVEDSSVKIRWRILGISHSKNLLKFFKDDSKNRNSNDDDDDLTEWLDGFSTFYINKQGLIKKHVMDRVIPEDTKVSRPKQSIAEKLGLKMPLPIPS